MNSKLDEYNRGFFKYRSEQLIISKEEIQETIPCGEEKIKAIQFRKKLADKISIEKENANKLLLIHEDEESQDFMSLYSHPVIKSESDDALGSNQSYLLTFSENSV